MFWGRFGDFSEVWWFLEELTKCALVIGWARRQGGADWLVLENESLKSIRGIEISEVLG